MANIKKHKEKIYPILVFGIIFITMYFINSHENSKLKISIYGKITDYKVAANIQTYYVYKFHYKNNLYKKSKYIANVDSNKIGRCFVVYIDPNDPKNSDLDLNREVNCKNYNNTTRNSSLFSK